MGTELQDRVGFFIGESRFLTFQVFFRILFCLFIQPMVLHITSYGFMPCAHPNIGNYSEYHISLNLLSVSLDARFTVEVKSLSTDALSFCIDKLIQKSCRVIVIISK